MQTHSNKFQHIKTSAKHLKAHSDTLEYIMARSDIDTSRHIKTHQDIRKAPNDTLKHTKSWWNTLRHKKKLSNTFKIKTHSCIFRHWATLRNLRHINTYEDTSTHTHTKRHTKWSNLGFVLIVVAHLLQLCGKFHSVKRQPFLSWSDPAKFAMNYTL